ncbi:hypothetical protein QBC47DRAFT_444038 [Echria macrotheca]|uniref:Uncharacterized protein n=1 Tax=Echria macrotheca TaxID=438768 RepID=A0AAJ0BF51_9PEZI|nr:hypothetical protein QBC47DRAFT_444038 [Echria macrotheca]
MASSAFSPSPNAPGSILTFTTPFPQPASCSSILTTSVQVITGYGTTATSTYLLPDTTDARYTACLAPAGGDKFSFSPAVCPQSWTAWWLGWSSVDGDRRGTAAIISTAYCCSPSFSLPEETPDVLSPSCVQIITATTGPNSNGGGPVETTALSKALVPAWHISWKDTDVSTLSPQPPAITSGRFKTWVPGSSPEPQPTQGSALGSPLFYFLVVGLPLIVVAAIIACLFFACRARFTRPQSSGRRGFGKKTPS